MYNKVLVPLDGSELSECSLSHVQEIAKGCKTSKVVLMRVMEPLRIAGYVLTEMGEDSVKSLEIKNKEAAIEYLNEKAKMLENAGLKVETIIMDGYAANTILDYSHKENMDLIIIATHGSTGFVRVMLGSVADKIVRHSVCPVLVVAPVSCRLPQ